MKTWQLIACMLLVALGVAYFSNRGAIPYVNPGKKLGAAA
jgi:hypothetical protein